MDTSYYEQAQNTAVGVAISHPDRIGSVLIAVRVEDFTYPWRYVMEAIAGLNARKENITVLSVVDELTRRGNISLTGGAAKVHELAEWGFGDERYACDVIARVAKLRDLLQVGDALRSEVVKPDADPLALAKRTIDGAQAVLDRIDFEGDVSTLSLGEFIASDDPPYDWVIPGLMERGDRMILTGSEGLGKSVLQRQIAVCAASGIHPFTHRRVKPRRVLYVDCENGPVKMRRALRPLATLGRTHGVDPADRMFVEAIPSGLDLTRAEDEAWLVRTVTAVQPDLLLTGPLYRLHAANPNDEEPARIVTRVLDRCRAAANCALITEGHAGHRAGQDSKRPVRPTGTSLWLRWPEFGYGMRAGDDYDPKDRVVDFVSWRGDREERAWPSRLRMGGAWPWSAVDDQSTNWRNAS